MTRQVPIFGNQSQGIFPIIEIATLSAFQKNVLMKLSRIKSALTKPGKSKSGLAEALGIPKSAVTSLLQDGGRKIKVAEIDKLTKYLELNKIPVMGRVGAGAVIEPAYDQVPPEGLFSIELPFQIPDDEMLAFEIAGDSMLPRYDDGDAIIVWKEQRRPLESFFGEEAAVRTEDGSRYLKVIRKGKNRSVVTLESFNAKPIENVKLEWIGEIYITMRAAQLVRNTKAVVRPRENTRDKIANDALSLSSAPPGMARK